ncbi:MAG: hypothetical protein HY951_09235 [Bacteroidia bacterium]|nr:hypothetical protein [Bacteroidia bacterium]
MTKIYLIVFLFILCIYSQAQTEKVVDWKTDIEFLKKELPIKHKNLFFSMTKTEFESKLDYISSNLSQFSNLEIAIKMQQVIAKIGDSHTTISYGKYINSDKILPLQLYWFSDGLYILKTTKDYEILLGSKITKINGINIGLIVDSLSTLITIDNQAIIKSDIPSMIPIIQLLEYFGFSKNNELKIEVESITGVSTIHEIKLSKINKNNIVSFKPDSIALCWQNQKVFFYDKYIENGAIYYLQYNNCWSREIEKKTGNKKRAKEFPSFVEFEKNVFNTIKRKPINKLIFDMRFNGGGSSRQGTEFINKLSVNKILNENIKIYVVIGRQTFSSAIINTMDFKEKTNAIFVGEETGGKPNHYGEVRTLVLPSSELKVNYSTKYFTRIKDDLKTITPDKKVEFTFLDFSKGIDPVYEWIIKQ